MDIDRLVADLMVVVCKGCYGEECVGGCNEKI